MVHALPSTDIDFGKIELAFYNNSNIYNLLEDLKIDYENLEFQRSTNLQLGLLL